MVTLGHNLWIILVLLPKMIFSNPLWFPLPQLTESLYSFSVLRKKWYKQTPSSGVAHMCTQVTHRTAGKQRKWVKGDVVLLNGCQRLAYKSTGETRAPLMLSLALKKKKKSLLTTQFIQSSWGTTSPAGILWRPRSKGSLSLGGYVHACFPQENKYGLIVPPTPPKEKLKRVQ